ncbi:MAG: hypothetical protein JGK24_08640 [Microcoleus sp. PH2017_29_MFU_D_A]|uniref:hypothetical protein n=1 Tax=unclassified Microcoleus TaxID=2642155 RepID=UPI001DD61A93|nr:MULTISPECIES: hypothetical protein [unclassified Microcoleus]MCC3420627.1 hypothetical protein [Microcoleus sp. PH2017_07_MST_O_A]MCC3430801.1 hypothetical protein [Microcoleus sp. PH2017_04_SCI_O_A]MCC3440381.1 hypothetical protein [Microcoleus sp. PH2017_03_ELD_O_A]MCC3466294.1 hypothetical protein [Microcoleus sp. PH2017_06_SFM_O_A]MCC3503961.1 hypothetical protein [Microcoleus sp. PH2017_19_SFW_U_A]MCC3508104.1 hypothetical protein [Microcoleus sp. PH2017_17_BER_D_A]TAE14114.1 MAG: hy
MNSLILISPEQAWGFQPILSGKFFLAGEIKHWHFFLILCNTTIKLSVFTELASNIFLAAVRLLSFFVRA